MRKLHPKHQRKHLVTIRGTEKETELWKQTADAIGISVSELARIWITVGCKPENVGWLKKLTIADLQAL